MAQEYRPYTTNRQTKSRRLKLMMLVMIAAIVGIVIFIRSRMQPAPPATAVQDGHLPRVALTDVLPAPRQTPSPAPAAVPTPAPANRVPEPSAAAPATTAVPVMAPAATPQAVRPAEQPAPALTETATDTAVSAAAVDDAMNKTSVEAQQLIERALSLRDAGKIIAARDLLNEALAMKLSPQVRLGVKIQMAKLSEVWLFGKDVLEGDKLTAKYQVQPGDLLAKIGRRHNVPYEILQKINGLARPESLQAGRRIKVIHGPFNAVVNRTDYTLDLYLQNMYVKTYKVGLGRPEHTTPTGRWQVAPGGKMIKPTWTDPDTGKTYLGSDPDYPLGSRWIALDGIEGAAKGRTGFAIHGTKDPETIGTQSSRGCIRLFNGDVVELYDLLEPGQSYVNVVD